jgi:UrcA family protein
MLIRIVSVLGAMAATAATLAFATPAAAQTEDRSVTVSIAGLDPANPADAVRLDRRLQSAARSVCGPDHPVDFRAHQATLACEKAAMARANSDVQLALRGSGARTIALSTN